MAARRNGSIRVLLGYTALRLLLFAVPFLIIWQLSGNPTLAAVIAAVIGLGLSVVLLDGQRGAMARLLADRVERRRPSSDEAAEDAVVDRGPDAEVGDAPDAERPAAGQTDSAAARPRP